MEYAVIKINSKQYIVSENSRLKVDRVTTETPVIVLGAGSDESFDFDSKKAVTLEILEDKKDKKILVRRYKSKSRYRKEKGHRQPISLLKVSKISDSGESKIIMAEQKVEVKAQKEIKPKNEKSTVKSEKLVKDLDITDKMKENLIENGYKTTEQIKKASRDEIIAIKGIGEKAYDKLMESLS